MPNDPVEQLSNTPRSRGQSGAVWQLYDRGHDASPDIPDDVVFYPDTLVFLISILSAGMLLSLFVINKAGGVVYQQDLSSDAPKISSNDRLRLGSTFHSIHAIAALAAPVASKGIVSMDTDSFRLQCFQTLTGTKFFITALPNISSVELEAVLRQIYELYADYVLKNPFYELEMPIRCHLFYSNLQLLVDKVNTLSAKRSY